MSDTSAILETLEKIDLSLQKAERRFADVESVEYFLTTEEGDDAFDSICMVLLAAGEYLKQIDTKTRGELLSLYPEADWKGIKGFRDIIAHRYFEVTAERLFFICEHKLAPIQAGVAHLIEVLRRELEIEQ